MKNRYVVSHKQRLDSLFEKANDFDEDIELKSHWARYLCVLVSGFVEESCRVLILEYISRKSSKEVAHFAGSHLRSFTNAKMNKIFQLIQKFGIDFHTKLEDATKGELKAAIDSIVANRHQIAHGKDVNISFVTIKKYYSQSILVVELLEELFES